MRLWPITSHLAICLPIAASFSLADRITAQTATSGALTGLVTDRSSAVVPDANIEIRENTEGVTRSTITDRAGTYHFFFLMPGRYTLAASRDGFHQERRTVDVLLGPPSTLNIVLVVARSTSEITVAEEVPLIQAENGDASATMSQKQVSELPNPGNDLTYIVQTCRSPNRCAGIKRISFRLT